MNFLRKRLVIIGGALAFATLAASQATAQRARVNTNPRPVPVDVVKKTAKVAIKPDVIQTFKHPPLTHAPFQALDLQTGAPVAPDALVTLSNGRKMSASEYNRQIEQIEKALNEQWGLTLRSARRTDIVQATKIDEKALNQQAQAILSNYKVKDAPTHDIHPLFRPRPTPDKVAAARASMAKSAGTEGLRRNNAYSHVAGDTNTFAVYANCATLSAAGPGGMDANITLEAGGYVFGDKIEMGKIFLEGFGRSTKPGSYKDNINTATLTVSVLGDTVLSDIQAGQEASSQRAGIGKTVQKTWDYSSPVFDYSIGPIGVTMSVGVYGAIGLSYNAVGEDSYAGADLDPFVNSYVYLQGDCDLGVADFGSRCDLTLLDYDLNVSNQAFLDQGGQLRTYAAAYDQLDALDGDLVAYVNVDLLLWSHEYDWVIWSWSGIHTRGDLFRDDHTTPVN